MVQRPTTHGAQTSHGSVCRYVCIWWEGPGLRLRPHCPNSPQVGQPLRRPQGSPTSQTSGVSPRVTTVPTVSAMIVTVDGPGGTGKSTVSRVLAHRAGLPHLDTGAFYRAATLAVVQAGADPTDEVSVLGVVKGLRLGQEAGRMYLDERDVSEEIRSAPVTAAVSMVSAHPGVRRELVKRQRAWIDSHEGRGVVEGRDIGSVVFPHADLKIFLDASPEVRARRRARESGADFDTVLADLNRRDHLDSTRPVSPMTIPDGAVVVDTSDLSFDEVVDRILELIEAKTGGMG